MPALNFKEYFVRKIKTGEKTQTIRPVHKRLIRVGDTLYLYTGQRTKKCRKLGEYVCNKTTKIRLEYYGESPRTGILFGKIFEGERQMSLGEIHNMILDDGFETIKEFFQFFVKTYKMQQGECKELLVIQWSYKKRNPDRRQITKNKGFYFF